MKYDMVFEGGGAKGMVFVGAMQELEQRGIEPARLIGASAGAIMATFLAAGYSASEMEEALNEKLEEKPVFMRFLEVPGAPSSEEVRKSALRKLLADINVRLIPDFIETYFDDALAALFAQSSEATGQIYSFIEKGGLYTAEFFLKWLHDKLNSGIYTLERGNLGVGQQRQFGDMNLEEYYQATGIELTLIGSDTSDARILILNHRTAPGCPVIYAVRMSMSFPLLWQEVVWQPEWGLYRGKDISGHSVVDGGMLSNFPIELFLSNESFVTDIMGEKETDEMNILGFLIDEGVEVPGAPGKVQGESRFNFGELRTLQRVNKLINTMTQAHDKIVIDTHEDFVVRLPAKGYGTTEFDMSDERRQALVNAGRTTTQAYFNRAAVPTEPFRAGTGVPAGVLMETDTVTASANRVAARILEQ